MAPEHIAALVVGIPALIIGAFWLYGIHLRAITAAEARGYQRKASEGVTAGFDAGWHPGMGRGAR